MKAAYIEEAGGPEKIKVGELPKPEPGQDKVLIRTYAAGVAPADWKTMAGTYRAMNFPYVPGLEAAGIVESAPEDSGLNPGDAVFGAVSGGYAEFAVTGPGHRPQARDAEL
jgi:NADPH2:quinone reductase